jgi:hypothetical protein
MKKNYSFTILVVLIISFLCVPEITAQIETEPNDYFRYATPVENDVMISCQFSSVSDVDIFKLELDVNYMYLMCSAENNFGFQIPVELYFASDTTVSSGNILRSTPAGRYEHGDFRIVGYVPNEYGNGTYYLRLESPLWQGTGDYKIRFFRNPLDPYSLAHEPDSSFAQALLQSALPTDGTRVHDMLYNINEPPYGAHDIDTYVMIGAQGNSLVVETEPVLGTPWVRDGDTIIEVWDANGSNTLGDNDDKDGEDEFGVNNTFSKVVIDSLPYTGIYFVRVVSWYSRYNGNSDNDSDPSRGEYLLYAVMGIRGEEVEPNNDPATATGIIESNVSLISANFSDNADMDYYLIPLVTTKMYSINSWQSSVGENIKAELFHASDPNTNLIDETVEGAYENNNFRLAGFVPTENGSYLLKVSPAPNSIGGTNTGNYKLRVGFGLLREPAETYEPNNSSDEADLFDPIAVDSVDIYAALYPQEDLDIYWFEGTEGDVITVEVLPPTLMEMWTRDLDTVLRLLDPSGNVVENNDFRDLNNISTFSRINGYTIQETGRVYIKVFGFYSDHNNNAPSSGNNNTGLYRIYVKSSAASPTLSENEPNDRFANAFPLPDGKTLLAKFNSASDIDMIKLELSTEYMYFINSTGSEVGAEIQTELFSSSDTTTNVLDSNVNGRYGGNNFRISGFIPPYSETYYLKLEVNNIGTSGQYKVRLRSSKLSEVANVHEPDNSLAEAEGLGDFNTDGVALTASLYNELDPEKKNDVDIYRFHAFAEQVMTATVGPVAGEEWFRDTDTVAEIVDEADNVIISNNDFGNTTFSQISFNVPADGTYYLRIYSFNSSFNSIEANHRNPGIGDYLLTLSGHIQEIEPNNTVAQAMSIPIDNSNLIEASFGQDDLEDWYSVSLNAENVYIFNTTASSVGANIRVELFKTTDPNSNLIDDSPFGRYESNDFRMSYNTQQSGDYLLKLSATTTALVPPNTGKYQLRVAGGDPISELASIHEPDDSKSQADVLGAFPTDSTIIKAGFHDNSDYDIYMFFGDLGNSVTIDVSSGYGATWIRDLDTKLELRNEEDNLLMSNDDKDDLFEELYGINNTFSHIKVDSLPYSGKYYVYVIPYFGTFNNNTASFGDNVIGAYNFFVKKRIPSFVEEVNNKISNNFELFYNYPNPFNAETIIKFNLPVPSFVDLVIYNIRGQKVTTLLNNNSQPGTHTIPWDGKTSLGVPATSGVYFYQLKVGTKFSKVGKMCLLR